MQLKPGLNEGEPLKRKRKEATQEQLDNPFHGVKLKQILEYFYE